MTTKSLEQIAQEAADEWFRDFEPKGDIPGRATLQSIILAACEKTVALVPDGMLSGGVQQMDAAAQWEHSDPIICPTCGQDMNEPARNSKYGDCPQCGQGLRKPQQPQRSKAVCTCNKENRGAKQHSSHCLAAQQPPATDTGCRDYHDVPFPEGTQPVDEPDAAKSRREQPPATEQEWTALTVDELSRSGLSPMQDIADAHNAALAAAEKQRDGFRRALEQRIGEVDELRQQLAAIKAIDVDLSALEKLKEEVPRVHLYESQLRQQLLAALAAIAEVKSWLDEQANKVRGKFLPLANSELLDERLAVFIETATFIRNLKPDLSVLEKHDAEVRKPLVDALKKARHRFDKTGWPEAAKDCADALAKARKATPRAGVKDK